MKEQPPCETVYTKQSTHIDKQKQHADLMFDMLFFVLSSTKAANPFYSTISFFAALPSMMV